MPFPPKALRLAIGALAALAACALAFAIHLLIAERSRTSEAGLPSLTYEELTGSVFAPPAADPFRAPRARVLKIPDFDGAMAIWGATGRDRRGRLWFGVSACCSGGSA
ncbi:MAG: hypothetical protein JNM90_24630, partial [Burkholderiales bacterium]|nr:hypothetical protein [Burkholderiales bacterium]